MKQTFITIGAGLFLLVAGVVLDFNNMTGVFSESSAAAFSANRWVSQFSSEAGGSHSSGGFNKRAEEKAKVVDIRDDVFNDVKNTLTDHKNTRTFSKDKNNIVEEVVAAVLPNQSARRVLEVIVPIKHSMSETNKTDDKIDFNLDTRGNSIGAEFGKRAFGISKDDISVISGNKNDIKDVGVIVDKTIESGYVSKSNNVLLIDKRKEKEKKKVFSRKLNDLSKVVHGIKNKKEKVQHKIHADINSGVEKVIKHTAIIPRDTVTIFNESDRIKRIENIKRRVQEKQDVISEEIADAMGTRSVKSDAVESVLRSSLDDIALLISDESGGADVDLSLRARKIIKSTKEDVRQIVKQNKELKERDGLALYRDTDKDGVSDYDEIHIYKTNPQNAFTSGTSLTDGERVLLGFDPSTASTERVSVESPHMSGVIVDSVFEVTKIATVTQYETSEKVLDDESGNEEKVVTTKQNVEKMVFAGHGLPNSFVTLYIFSTPIVVTVKTDTNGSWTYVLDETLEDGEHELHIATVDNAGKILAKSRVIPFVKQAEAVTFTPLMAAPAAQPITPIDILQANMLIVGGLALLIFGFIALITTGVWRSEQVDAVI